MHLNLPNPPTEFPIQVASVEDSERQRAAAMEEFAASLEARLEAVSSRQVFQPTFPNSRKLLRIIFRARLFHRVCSDLHSMRGTPYLFTQLAG